MSSKKKRPRLTKKGKRVTQSKNSIEHLVFTSKTHKLDRESAQRIRSKMAPIVKHKPSDPFPVSDKISFQGHFMDSAGKVGIGVDYENVGEFDALDSFKMEKEDTFKEKNGKLRKLCSSYMRKDKRPGYSDIKSKTSIYEINVSLGAAYSNLYAEAFEYYKDKPEQLEDYRKQLVEIAKAGMREICEISGYLPVYCCCHPDSKNQISFHFGLSPVDPVTKRLVGKSADGKKGRKGLRLLGDAFMCILRNAKYVDLPECCISSPKHFLTTRNADWKVGEALERTAENFFGEAARKKAKAYGENIAREWLARYQAANGSLWVEELEDRNRKLVSENEKLKKHVNAFLKNRKPVQSNELEINM